MTTPYILKLDLRVLDHLGIKLYSNAAAVLSEAVANAWDADAQLVRIEIQPDYISIEDNGTGMGVQQINGRFLFVGYDKRTQEGQSSGRGRAFMGRKGIGKLALFSIAEEIQVHTREHNKDGHAFTMRTEDIRTAVKDGANYYPVPIPFDGPSHGTKIILRELKKKRTAATIPALRKRIARRFSVIGHQTADGDKFEVMINGQLVTPKDREDLRAIEFLWEFGHSKVEPEACPLLGKKFIIDDVISEERGWRVSGWLGAAEEPKKLKHDEAGSMNGIVVLARGRLIQEKILDKLNFSRILVSYIVGQVDADFLDAEGEDDVATSDRQRVIEDDERYIALVGFLQKSLISIQDQWTELRNEARGKQAITEIPALADWLDSLPTGQRKLAARLLGLIRGVNIDDEQERRQLYRSGMLAFERLRLREETHILSQLSTLTAEKLLPLLSDLSTLEASLYRDIVRTRLDVIKEFESLVDENEKEKVLQKHLFDHMWLLDPGWERAAGSERIEKILKKDYREFDPKLTDKESKGRVDIRYKTNAGQHIIVELKRAKRRLSVAELLAQGAKYRAALHKCLTAEGVKNPHISIVFVVGTPLEEEGDPGGREMIEKTLSGINGRVIQYETLIHGARESYAEYLKQSAKMDHLDAILKKL